MCKKSSILSTHLLFRMRTCLSLASTYMHVVVVRPKLWVRFFVFHFGHVTIAGYTSLRYDELIPYKGRTLKGRQLGYGLVAVFLVTTNDCKQENWLALPVGNEAPSTFTGWLGMKLPSFHTKGQLEKVPPPENRRKSPLKNSWYWKTFAFLLLK